VTGQVRFVFYFRILQVESIFMRISLLFFLLLFFSLLSCGGDDQDSFDCSTSTLAISFVNATNATSCVNADGSIDVVVTGGKEPYTFTVNGVAAEGPVFQNLSSGIYSIIVKDKNKCERLLENVAVLADGFAFNAEVTEDTECVDGNGSITVNVTEGVGPYEYRIGNGAFTGNNKFLSLNQGAHDLELKDGNGCTVSLRVTVPRGNTGTSFSDEILPMIKTHCAVSGCHNGLDRTDLREYVNAKKHAAEIKSLTRSREMPFEGTPLTQRQIELFSCWVDDGAVDN
jgi:hypothetical protein